MSAVTGAVTKLFPLTAAADDTCSSPTFSSANAIYAVCSEQSDPNLIGKVTLQAISCQSGLHVSAVVMTLR